ncbi:hypothetical protein FDECE_13059 [Fusarium decemcellulare]|nr:hypothetical protein FDECE_13059 [Fusarium decemcellulare]
MGPQNFMALCITFCPSGKVDEQSLSFMVRDQLRESPDGLFDTLVGHLCSGASLEHKDVLTNHIADLFSGGSLSTNEDLRYRGLTSVDFMFLIKKANAICGVSLTFQEVMRNPSIQSIASLIKEKLQQPGTTSGPGSYKTSQTMIPDAPTNTGCIPASQSQELILLAQNTLQNHACNCNFVIHIESFPLDPEKFISSLMAVCARHEVLRSTYHDQQDYEGNHRLAYAYF